MTTGEYLIKVKGRLGPEWTDWFDGLTVTAGAGGETTTIRGRVDEAGLYGLLGRVRDLGLPLLSVILLPDGETEQTTPNS